MTVPTHPAYCGDREEAGVDFERRRRAARAGQTIASPRQAYELVRSGILEGLYEEGYKFDEAATMQAIPATRAAVRGALEMLADEGLVLRRQNFGTVVKQTAVPIPVGEFLGRANSVILRDVRYEDVSYRKVSAPEIIRRGLGLGVDDAEVICSERVVSVAGNPVELRISYFPVWDDPLPRFRPVTQWSELPDFETRFRDSFGSDYLRSHVTISAVTGDERTCRLLGVPEANPLLLRTLRLFDASERVREVAFSYHPGDRVTFIA
jgi:GntR family transcriptional regulator